MNPLERRSSYGLAAALGTFFTESRRSLNNGKTHSHPQVDGGFDIKSVLAGKRIGSNDKQLWAG